MKFEFGMNREKDNYMKYCLSKTFEQIARVFSIGTVIQTFMLEYGIGESQTALYASLVQIANAVMIFCMIFLAGKIQKEKLAITIVLLASALAPITLLFFALFTNIAVSTAFVVIAIVSLLINLALGLQTVLFYTFPYKVIDMKDFGKFCGIIGTVSYPACLFSIFLMTFFTARFPYFSVMAIFFVIAIIAWGLSAFFLSKLEENNEISAVIDNAQSSDNKKFNIFKYKPVYFMFLPNLLRGFAVGVIGQMIVFGYHDNILNGDTANWVSFLYYAGIMSSNLLYLLFFKNRNTAFYLLLLSGIASVLMPFVVVSGNVYVFLIVYYVMYAILGVFDTMLPVMLTKMIPYEGIGAFTSIRMFLMSVGTAIPGLIFDWLYGIFNTVEILILGGVNLFLCALIYALVMWYLQYKKNKGAGK